MILYLAMIALLPAAYVRMHSSFYYTTIQWDADLVSEKNTLVTNLKGMMAPLLGIQVPDMMHTMWLEPTITLRSIPPLSRSVEIEGSLVERHAGEANSEVWHWYRISTTRSLRKPGGVDAFISLVITGYIDENHVRGQGALWSEPDGFEDEWQRRVFQYAEAMQGLAAYGAASYWRMLYFSAITATTVGYGDIVPVTRGSRALAASEAVFGVVLIGLFLNSLAREVGERVSRNPPPVLPAPPAPPPDGAA